MYGYPKEKFMESSYWKDWENVKHMERETNILWRKDYSSEIGTGEYTYLFSFLFQMPD